MTGTRQRILAATAELFRTRGYHATSLKQVTIAAHAPFGSLYHFFPGGKEELAAEVIQQTGRTYQELFESLCDSFPSPATGIAAFFAGAAAALHDSGYIDICPVITVAGELAGTSDRLREATARVFEGWTTAAEQRLRAAGLDEPGAHELAEVVVATLQGSLLLSRSRRSPDPLQ